MTNSFIERSRSPYLGPIGQRFCLQLGEDHFYKVQHVANPEKVKSYR